MSWRMHGRSDSIPQSPYHRSFFGGNLFFLSSRDILDLKAMGRREREAKRLKGADENTSVSFGVFFDMAANLRKP
jgi:hypothetical protein